MTDKCFCDVPVEKCTLPHCDSHKKPDMLVDADWLRRKVEADPDMDCGVAPQTS